MKRTPLARRPSAMSSASRARPRAEHLAGTKPGNPIPPEVRALVRDRSGGRCEIRSDVCAGTAAEQHHRKRRRDGGHSPANLLHACSACHRMAHAQPRVARELGWIVSAFETDPALVPVRNDDGQTATWLHPDGTKTTERAVLAGALAHRTRKDPA